MDEVSTYLAKGKKLPGAQVRAQVPHAEFTAPQPSALWRLDPIIGQRYAQVSGDFNPIHLNGLAAKGFGFPRQIAHGMYTASRALSAMDPRLEAYRWDVSFAKPILLPGTAAYAVTEGRVTRPHGRLSSTPNRASRTCLRRWHTSRDRQESGVRHKCRFRFCDTVSRM
jgi:acyl dehydratase